MLQGYILQWAGSLGNLGKRKTMVGRAGGQQIGERSGASGQGKVRPANEVPKGSSEKGIER